MFLWWGKSVTTVHYAFLACFIIIELSFLYSVVLLAPVTLQTVKNVFNRSSCNYSYLGLFHLECWAYGGDDTSFILIMLSFFYKEWYFRHSHNVKFFYKEWYLIHSHKVNFFTRNDTSFIPITLSFLQGMILYSFSWCYFFTRKRMKRGKNEFGSIVHIAGWEPHYCSYKFRVLRKSTLNV